MTSPDDADFIVAHGTEAVNGAGDTDAQRAAGIELKAMEDMRGLLRRAARRNIPMMVANPDYGAFFPPPAASVSTFTVLLIALVPFDC